MSEAGSHRPGAFETGLSRWPTRLPCLYGPNHMLNRPVHPAIPHNASRHVDVRRVLDTTGSMSTEIASLVESVAEIVASLGRLQLDWHSDATLEGRGGPSPLPPPTRRQEPRQLTRAVDERALPPAPPDRRWGRGGQ